MQKKQHEEIRSSCGGVMMAKFSIKTIQENFGVDSYLEQTTQICLNFVIKILPLSDHHSHFRGVAKGGPGWAFALPSNLPVAHSSALSGLAIILFAHLARLMHSNVLNYLLYENMYCTCTFLSGSISLRTRTS